jgi:predicted transcriptional regulator
MSKSTDKARTAEITTDTDLSQIKRLLVLLLLKAGATQNELGEALGVTQATISRHYAMRKPQALTVTVQRSPIKEI